MSDAPRIVGKSARPLDVRQKPKLLPFRKLQPPKKIEVLPVQN